ncbi:LPS export ABC transporter permease LptF [Parashewanella spongiae]|uniref:LPS export ABC transporter permease LptF n=1 Tax=Parashewanella spongiae TaxID=342950 RepID=UPI00105A0399|nr:LPS export ABC transporter permease LptF [Parashewanella spongiae]MCL1079761.1 LPS export ABC transporter permease LptF [Parashewanella spongiae]
MIVFRYLIREVFKAQLAVLTVLLTIFISQHFVRILADATDGDFPASLITTLLALELPTLAVLILPLSLFLGIMLAHGRMYAENEMVVFHSVGISEWYVTRVTLAVTIFNVAITAALSLYIAPWAEEQQNVLLEKAQSEAGLSAIIPGRFQTSANGRAVLFIEDKDKKNNLSNVFVAQLPEKDNTSGQTNIVVAESGRVVERQDGEQQLVLDQGVRYQGSPHSLNFQVIEFGGYQMQIQDREVEERRRKLSAMSSFELFNTSGPEAAAEFHWRVAIPLAIIMMTLIAVPMSRVNVRQGKFAKMFPAILLYLGYFGMMVAAKKALEDEVYPSYLGMWWIHLSAFIIAVLLLSKERPIGARMTGLVKEKNKNKPKQVKDAK